MFETFECSGQILLMPILKQQVDSSPNSLQILCLLSFSWKICPLYFFSSNNAYFTQKEPIKMKIFENFFKCSGQNLSNFLCQFWNDKLIPPQVLYPSSVSWKTIPLYFLSQTLYTLLKSSPLKWKCLRLSSARVKFRQIPCANFETTSRFLSKFCISLQFHERLFHCTFFSSNNTYFAQKEPIKVEIFENFECSGEILLNSLCQFWNGKSIPLQILYLSSVSWKIIPLYFFSSKNIYFSQKKPNKMKIFEALKCSGQILSNSLCQFWNDKSIHLQILYPPSVSWKITPLYCF